MNSAKIFMMAVLPFVVAGAQTAEVGKAEILVKRAIAYAKQNGIEKVIQQTNQANGVFHVGSGGELYLYVYDLKGTMKANGYKTELVGQSRFDATDPDGKFFVREFIKTVKEAGKGWVNYKYSNPSNGKLEPKTAYVQEYEGLIFCCGTYKK
jgi:signal transduction histidine kinase